ncbi:lysophospholipase L1-like esterase [Natranaerovirga pectinivora]|uniref:Lysophospholipase L1-like esterase n=1 Tax=Natranaerovirga pectinivora TaxID=682400 RepID=A0A4R3MQD6_9FIRM|nr:rhamnogalacturonan acetylesterase [Natranaerovirga pectinivora]TCT15381.1 lysophospholipase L1-like esterase [Natranaerovirga pectinivora]
MAKTKVFLAGDSTVAYNDISTYPQTGWGQVLQMYLKDNVQVVNYAKNGRSSKSFIHEGLLDEIENEISENDFLLIQFGHNDQKEEEHRRTEPFTTYQYYLSQYIDVAINHNAYPIFITPLYRRHFDDKGNIKDKVHLDFPDAMEALAKDFGVPIIDLCNKSKNLFELIGDAESRKLFMHLKKGTYKNYPEGKEDDTHLNYEGAITVAGLIVDGLKALGERYLELVKY